MCRRIAEGIRWNKCGHFQRQFVAAIVDCSSPKCERSYLHPKGCRDKGCIQNFGPDIERATDTDESECFRCRTAAARKVST